MTLDRFSLFSFYLHNDEFNSRFHMGISIKYHVHVRASHYIHSTLADCYILKYFLLNLVQSHHGLRGDFGHTNIWFFKVILLQGCKILLSVTDLLWAWYKYLTQTAPFIIKPVDGRFDCSFFTNSGKFDHFKIDRF